MLSLVAITVIGSAIILYTAPTSKADLGNHLKVCSRHQMPKAELACGKMLLHKHSSAARWIKNHVLLNKQFIATSSQNWTGRYRFHLWMKRRAERWIKEATRRLTPLVPKDYITSGLLCIHHYEGAWNDPNSPYWGGLQMDLSFQTSYGHTFYNKWGTADHWPIWAQLLAGRRAYHARGFEPWPNTARDCGLL